MKNHLSDLSNHLFAQLERLSDEDMSADDIEREATRAEAIVTVADQITRAAGLQLRAAQLIADHGRGIVSMIPETITGKLIEHRAAEKAETADPQRAEIEARKRARAIADEAEERARQAKESAS